VIVIAVPLAVVIGFSVSRASHARFDDLPDAAEQQPTAVSPAEHESSISGPAAHDAAVPGDVNGSLDVPAAQPTDQAANAEPTPIESDAPSDVNAEPVLDTVEASIPLARHGLMPVGPFALPVGAPAFAPAPSAGGQSADGGGPAISGSTPVGSAPLLFSLPGAAATTPSSSPGTPAQTPPSESAVVPNPQGPLGPHGPSGTPDVPSHEATGTKNVAGGPANTPRILLPGENPPTIPPPLGSDDPGPGSIDDPSEPVSVPEPGTLLLLGGGAATLALRRFRRGRSAPKRVDSQPA
jgi:hypothetical protein